MYVKGDNIIEIMRALDPDGVIAYADAYTTPKDQFYMTYGRLNLNHNDFVSMVL
jgi:hypothetical protein